MGKVDALGLPMRLQEPDRVHGGEAPDRQREKRQPQDAVVEQHRPEDDREVPPVTDLREPLPRRFDEGECEDQRDPAANRLHPDHRVHEQEGEQDAARHRRQRLGEIAGEEQPPNGLLLLIRALRQRELGVVEEGEVGAGNQAERDRETSLERHELPEPVGEDQPGLAQAEEDPADDHRAAPPEHVGHVAGRHFEKHDQRREQRLQQQHVRQRHALRAEENDDDRHHQQEALEEGQQQGATDVALEL